MRGRCLGLCELGQDGEGAGEGVLIVLGLGKERMIGGQGVFSDA